MKVLKSLFSRLVITGLLILLQIISFIYLIFSSDKYLSYLYFAVDILAFVLTLHLVSKSQEPSLKIPWLLVIALFPIAGVPAYLLFAENGLSKKYISLYSSKYSENDKDKIDNEDVVSKVEDLDMNVASQFKYIYNSCGVSVSDGTRTEFLKSGEIFFDRLLLELKKAKKYIFMEYYIIEEGKMWDSILTILKKKVDEGVDVRIIFDDLGCIKTLPYRYDRKLRRLGIKCYKFNRFIPIVSAAHNNRDHRKITIIDGKVGFMGGINLADEYINEKVKYGHWKDTGIFIEGKAVDRLVDIFIPFYNILARIKDDVDKYKNSDYIQTNEFVQVYTSGPKLVYDEYVGEDVYLNLINSATKYLYITTPYLVTDYNIMHALELAVKKGVDVRIITPHIPDKKIIYIMTQQSYEYLLKAGVKIYEYTPGFIHSKTITCDDNKAIVGTINFDYRSMIHNFECGAFVFNSATVLDMKNDFKDVVENSQEMTLEECKVNWIKDLFRKMLALFAPLF